VNGGTEAAKSDCVIATVIETFAGAVTPISVETDIAMVSSMAVDTFAPSVGEDACVDCACELCVDDAEVPLGRAFFFFFKVLPLLK